MAIATGSRRWYNDPITPRQRGAIRLIQELLGHEFDGRVKGQAMAFIGEHYDEAKRIRDNRPRGKEAQIQSMRNRHVAKKLLEEAGPWAN